MLWFAYGRYNGKIIKDTLHAAGVDIGIYTQDFENEFISLTDIARYKSDDPTQQLFKTG